MAGVDLTIRAPAHFGFSPADLSPAGRAQIVGILDTVAREWAEAMLRLWPVDTRRSQQAWEFFARSGDLALVIRNPVDYVEWVHRAGEPRTALVWEELERVALTLLDRQAGNVRAIVARDRLASVAARDTAIFGRLLRTERLTDRLGAAVAAAFARTPTRERDRARARPNTRTRSRARAR